MNNLKKEYIKSIYDNIEKLKNDLDDPRKSEIFYNVIKNELGDNFKPKVSKECAAISYFLNKEGINDFSEMTLYRIFRIKDNDKSGLIYEKLKNSDIKVKQAYNILFPPNKIEKKEISVSVDINEEPDFKSIYSELKLRNEQIDAWKIRLSKEPNNKLLREIDGELYKMRQLLWKVMSYYDENE